ncbi:hypothetical protein VNI00_017913 [Paramarasmius palmivorus]|uniref:Uncharacterized protein n=1 Tax=Paramarasmius palmivorus TaxID=297713 RepID=A0AAW0B571_9AGAR
MSSLRRNTILEQDEPSMMESDSAISLPAKHSEDDLPQTTNVHLDEGSEKHLASLLLLPFLFVEYRKGSDNILAGMNQARLVSTCRGSQSSALYDGIYMADTNCPEWDITDPSRALKFALFLISLKNNYVPEPLAAVEVDIKAELEKMQGEVAGSGERFKWAITHLRNDLQKNETPP